MVTSANNRKNSNMADSPEQKKRKVKSNTTQCLADNFLKWCADVGLILNDKVLYQLQNNLIFLYTHIQGVPKKAEC